jgi:hypothetical protein
MMPHAKTDCKSVSRGQPCPLCDGADGCSLGADGLILCRRREGPQAGFVSLGKCEGDPQWSMYRREGDPLLNDGDRRNGNGRSPSASSKPAVDWTARAEGFTRQLTPDRAEDLAAALGLPVNVLAELRIGYCDRGPHSEPGGPCWTFPEAGATGRVIGLTCRYADGTKKAWPGGRRGLTIPCHWREQEGAIYLPEGPSDVLTLAALGLSAIGRPSNTGGVELLAELLRDVPTERRIVILGEWDPKPSGEWPGRDGAAGTAAALEKSLGRPFAWSLPPNGAKDVRAWALTRKLPRVGEGMGDDWSIAGEQLAEDLAAGANASKPADATKKAEGDAGVFGFRWEPTDSAVFAGTDYRPEWLVRGVLVARQPAVIGGPQKTLKTTLAVDLALALASGTPWLGKFPCPARKRVAVLSGESGAFTLQETARRVCAAKGIALGDLGDMLLWQFTLPQLANLSQLDALGAGLAKNRIDVVLVDPLYLALLAGAEGAVRAENLYEVGPLLLRVAVACLSAEATPILLHHTRKTAGTVGEPLELTDLAFSGVAEFARQWLLVCRRERFEPGTGVHRLWLALGGSVGHTGLYAVDVDEGQLGEDFTGRRWQVTVDTATDARTRKAEDKQAAKQQEAEAKVEADARHVLYVLEVADRANRGMTFTALRDAAGLGNTSFGRAVTRLQETERIDETPGTVSVGNKARRPARIIRRRLPEQQQTLPEPEPDRQPTAAELREQAKERQRQADVAAVVHALEVNDPDNLGMSYAAARNAAGLTDARFGAAVTTLKATGKILANGDNRRTLQRCQEKPPAEGGSEEHRNNGPEQPSGAAH